MRLGFARRTENKYGADIAKFVGGSTSGAQFQWDRGLSGPAETTGNVVKLNPRWFSQASRKDARGAIIHELTHVARGQHPEGTGAWADQPEEVIADAVRLSLNGKRGINPDSFPAARKLANQRGWFTGGNMAGPGSNLTGTRANNTLIHNASKRTPVLGPSAAVGLNSQLQGLETTFAGARALQAASIASAKSTAVLGRQQAKSTAVASMGSAVSNALSRGIVGSSVDSSQRAGVVAQLAADRAAVTNTKVSAIGAARANTLQALGQYYTGVGQVASSQAAQQAEMAIAQYQNDELNTNLSDFQNLVQRYLRGRKQDLHRNPNTPGNLGNAQLPHGNQAVKDRYDPDYWQQRPVGPIHSAGPHPY